MKLWQGLPIFIILTRLSSVLGEDLYKLLGVTKNADNRDIRKAFKKLALKYHQYQSWNYYHDDFGIYDDDKEIVTLDSADFRR